MSEHSSTNRSQARFQIMPDMEAEIEFLACDRYGVPKRGLQIDHGLAFALRSECRVGKAYGFAEGELVIIDLDDILSSTSMADDDEETYYVVPVRAVVARGVAL